MRRLVARAALAAAVGMSGLTPAAAAPPLGPCDAEFTNAPAGTSAEPCTYNALVSGLTGTLRLTVTSGRAEGAVSCTYGSATLTKDVGVYDIRFTRVGRCTLRLTSLATSTTTTSSAKAASL